ncbi:MAG: patatin-like phospholipase family protein [Candidatus Latescibacterota bacterium]|nr:MAG: patatin-like phospholipase family protein [Candidatus Latescibacterota bacterium]
MPFNGLPIGVALSGGTAKAVAHIGALQALQESELPINRISGASGGSMVAVFFASGMSVQRMTEVASTLSWGKLVKIRLSRLGVISSKPIEEFVREQVGDLEFSELNIPCSVIATDLATGERKAFESGDVARAVRASCTIPQIFLPVEIGDRYYVDGGFSEYLPIETLREKDEMFVIGVHLAHKVPMYGRPRNYLQLAIHITGLVARTNYVVSMRKADILIHPDMDDFSPFDFEPSERLVKAGYDATVRMIPDIVKAWKRKNSRLRRLLRRMSPHRS